MSDIHCGINPVSVLQRYCMWLEGRDAYNLPDSVADVMTCRNLLALQCVLGLPDPMGLTTTLLNLHGAR